MYQFISQPWLFFVLEGCIFTFIASDKCARHSMWKLFLVSHRKRMVCAVVSISFLFLTPPLEHDRNRCQKHFWSFFICTLLIFFLRCVLHNFSLQKRMHNSFMRVLKSPSLCPEKIAASNSFLQEENPFPSPLGFTTRNLQTNCADKNQDNFRERRTPFSLEKLFY